MSASAQEHIEKRYSIYFRVGKSDIDRTYLENGHVIETMTKDILTTLEVDGFIPDSLLIYASASPEGPDELNARLARLRAESAKRYILQILPQLSVANISIESRTNDWSGILQAARADERLPYREQIIRVLSDSRITNKDAALRAMPAVYAYIRDNMLNKLRTATVTIRVVGRMDEFAAEQETTIPAEESRSAEQETETPTVAEPEPVQENPAEDIIIEENPENLPSDKKPFYMGIKNNMLYDLGIVPNIGAEFYLGGNVSIAGNWMYSWWKNDKVHWYWRTYGGDLALRYWFGKASKEKPLQGHHVGLYGQIITYDFEVGNKGLLADRWSWTAGIEYGYSLPVARRLNIDFTIGAGYHTGQFYEYLPIDGHYVWQATKNRTMIGPTKLEISLVWLLGYGNENEKKGGKR